ncbi:MAG TPA: TonB-dependent receptor plug domain-containing protein, partial [Oscillatoriaceae cyanobacterium]
MSTRRLAVLLPTIAVLAIAPVAHAETLDLDALFNTAQVGIATRHVQSAREAPANVEVITDTEIRERGYTTVAEALRALPGFYIVNDELLPSVGVRGISSGERGWSRILKLMIDGQPVPYRPDGSNWLGPELIPIGLVKRIEVIRGPASALYGADAFLGVVNVVTKRGADIDGLRLDAMAGTRAGHPIERGQLDLATLPDTHGLDLTFGALAGLTDNSGLPLPGTSPNQATLAKNGQTVSARDFDYPASAFAR